VSARYEIRAASSEECVFVPPNLYDVIARRSVRKQRVQMVTMGFILVVLVQWVCGWAGFGISWLWFRRLLALLFLAPRRVDSASTGSWVSGRS